MEDIETPQVPSLLLSEPEALPPFPNPCLRFPKTEEAIGELKRQNDEIVSLKARVLQAKRKERQNREFNGKIISFSNIWGKASLQISAFCHEKNYDEALKIASSLPLRIEGSPYPLNVEKEAATIRPWLICRLTSLFFAEKENRRESIGKEEAERHYQRCLSLPVGLEEMNEAAELIDSAKGFLYSACSSLLEKGVSEVSLFLPLLPFWRMGLSDKIESEATRIKKKRFGELLLNCYNSLSESCFKKKRDLELALTLFRLRDLFPKGEIRLAPFRYAYDEKELKLYFYESEAIESKSEEFATRVSEFASAISSPDDFHFLVLAHLLALQGLKKERFDAVVKAIRPFSFELKIELFAASIALGMEPLHMRAVLKEIEKTHPKKGNLEKLGTPLLFIKEHLNEALLLRFNPLLEDLLRSPHAHKVAGKSNDIAFTSLYGKPQGQYRPRLGCKAKRPTVRSWGKGAWACYLVFGVALPLVACLLSGAFIYLYRGIPDRSASFWTLIPFFSLLLFLFATVSGWSGRDERGGASLRSALLSDAIWKACLAASYFIAPSSLPGLARIRYALLIAPIAEGLLAFFYCKPTKKTALLDYFLFGALFVSAFLAIVFMVLDMMWGLLA